jgi:hypothetical protein
MKKQFHFARWLALLLLLVAGTGAMAQQPFPEQGPQDVCLTGIAEPYGVEPTLNSTYTWTIDNLTVSPNWTLNNSNTNVISVVWLVPGTYTVQVVETNSEGCDGPMITVPVTVHALPTVDLTGPSPVCLNSTGNVYTTDAGNSNYTWVVLGGTITAGGGLNDNTVTITWDGVAPFSVSVNYEDINGCTAASPTVLPVTVNPEPVPALAGPTPVCFNSAGNVYTTDAGMSDYIWVVNGGTITAGGGLTDNTVTVTWDGVAPYSVSVNYTAGTNCTGATPTVLPVVVNPLPVVALAGPTPVCFNDAGNVYTTDAGNSNYTWVVFGGTVTAGGGLTDNTVTVTWDGVAPFSVSVNYTTPDGCTAASPTVLPITVNPLPVVALAGPTPVCLNSTGNVYTTDAGNSNYTWVVLGGTITAGGGLTDNTVTITWDGVAPFSVSVNYTTPDGCTAASPTVLPVTVNPEPVPALAGPTPVCFNSAGNVYTTDAGMSDYIWVVNGGTITAGGGLTDNTVTVTWDGVAPYSVSVNYTAGTNCTGATPTVLPVVVNPLPVVALAGPTPVCFNDAGNVYTTDAGNSNYTWVVFGGTVTAGGGLTDNTVTVTWDGVAPFSVSVNYTTPDGCTAASPTVLPITVNPLPVVALAGPTPVCLNSTGNVYTTDAGNSNYTWVVLGGTITAGGGLTDNTVTITWDGVAPFSVSVNYTTPDGCTAASPTVLPVTVNPEPVPALAGPTPVCFNSAGNVYTTDAGMSDYIWVVNGGTITAGGGLTDNTVTVTWDGVAPYSVSVNYTAGTNCTGATPTVLPVVVTPLPSTSVIYHN